MTEETQGGLASHSVKQYQQQTLTFSLSYARARAHTHACAHTSNQQNHIHVVSSHQNTTENEELFSPYCYLDCLVFNARSQLLMGFTLSPVKYTYTNTLYLLQYLHVHLRHLITS